MDRADHSNNFNYKNDGGQNASCCAATGRKYLTSPGIADMYTLLMNTWNKLLETYQQRVYTNTLARVKRQIQQVENATPATAISVEAVCVDNAILLYSLASKAEFEEPEIWSTDSTILMDNHCNDDELHFGMPGGSGDCKSEGDKSDEHDAIPTTRQQWLAVTEIEAIVLGTIDVYGDESDDGNDVDMDEEEEASQAD